MKPTETSSHLKHFTLELQSMCENIRKIFYILVTIVLSHPKFVVYFTVRGIHMSKLFFFNFGKE